MYSPFDEIRAVLRPLSPRTLDRGAVIRAGAKLRPRRTPKKPRRLTIVKDLRDTFASHLLTGGVDVVDVSRWLGHADTNVTRKHYARWLGGAGERLADGRVATDLLADMGA